IRPTPMCCSAGTDSCTRNNAIRTTTSAAPADATRSPARKMASSVDRAIGELNHEVMHGAGARESHECIGHRIGDVRTRDENPWPVQWQRAVGDRLGRSLDAVPAQDLDLLAPSYCSL